MPRLQLLTVSSGQRLRGSSGKKVNSPQRYRYGTRKFILNIGQRHLDYIINQVRSEGYHVEYISRLGWDCAGPLEVIAAIQRWAQVSRLKITINQERDVCFFEQLE